MAEAIYHGKTASAYYNKEAAASTVVANMLEWSVTLSADVADTTVMGNTVGKTCAVGFRSATITLTTLLLGDRIAVEGDVGGMELLRGATDAMKGYYFPYSAGVYGVVCTGAVAGVNKDGIETMNYSFVWSDSTAGTSLLTNSVTLGTPP